MSTKPNNEKIRISVVIPARNEEKNVENIVNLLIKNLNSYLREILIVNDNSTDKTYTLLKELAKKNPKIKPINLKGKKGVGNAIKEGLHSISSKSNYVLMLDCDFVENIPDIKKMIKSINSADGFLGSRYMDESRLVNYPFAKKIANRCFHFLLKKLLTTPHIDLTNNFKLYKIDIINKIKPLLKSEGFSINAETGIYPLLLGYTLKEIPVSWIGRTPEMGTSNFGVFKAGPGYVKVLYGILKLKLLKDSLR